MNQPCSAPLSEHSANDQGNHKQNHVLSGHTGGNVARASTQYFPNTEFLRAPFYIESHQAIESKRGKRNRKESKHSPYQLVDAQLLVVKSPNVFLQAAFEW